MKTTPNSYRFVVSKSVAINNQISAFFFLVFIGIFWLHLGFPTFWTTKHPIRLLNEFFHTYPIYIIFSMPSASQSEIRFPELSISEEMQFVNLYFMCMSNQACVHLSSAARLFSTNSAEDESSFPTFTLVIPVTQHQTTRSVSKSHPTAPSKMMQVRANRKLRVNILMYPGYCECPDEGHWDNSTRQEARESMRNSLPTTLF